MEQLTEARFFDHNNRSVSIATDEKAVDNELDDCQTIPPVEPIERVGWKTEIQLLFTREFRHLLRAKGSFLIRMGTTIFFGLLYGIIYFSIGNADRSNQINVTSTFGAISVFLVTTISGVAQSSLMDFPKDRQTFLREYSTNHYSSVPYFISHFCFEVVLTLLQTFIQVLASYYLMDLHINFSIFWFINVLLAVAMTSLGSLLGSAVDNPDVAIQLMPALVVPQMLFSGFFISTEMIPLFLRWIQYICALTYAMRLALLYEFDDCSDESCIDTLERNGVYELDSIWYWLILLSITICFRLASMVILRGKANFG
jgi:ABC-type multidrug transport system permease subunit